MNLTVTYIVAYNIKFYIIDPQLPSLLGAQEEVDNTTISAEHTWMSEFRGSE